jgi:pyridoxal phosphate enzyme (YggS family)
MPIFTPQQFRTNLETIKASIEKACGSSHRNPADIRIMAVTKTHSREYAEIAIGNGISLLGENKVQEAREKYNPRPPECELHLIGHLQRNKASIAAGIFSCIESIDKLETCEALAIPCEKLGTVMEILIEINTSGESSKSGITNEADYFKLLDKLMPLRYIEIRGVMTIGPLTTVESDIRKSFSALKNIFDETKNRFPALRFDVLSMGMSGDYTIAVEEGSTLVRIGTALFGDRA